MKQKKKKGRRWNFHKKTEGKKQKNTKQKLHLWKKAKSHLCGGTSVLLLCGSVVNKPSAVCDRAHLASLSKACQTTSRRLPQRGLQTDKHFAVWVPLPLSASLPVIVPVSRQKLYPANICNNTRCIVSWKYWLIMEQWSIIQCSLHPPIGATHQRTGCRRRCMESVHLSSIITHLQFLAHSKERDVPWERRRQTRRRRLVENLWIHFYDKDEGFNKAADDEDSWNQCSTDVHLDNFIMLNLASLTQLIQSVCF